MHPKIDVLDKGYVILIGSMGSELELVNDLKASFARESQTYGPREDKLLRSCFRRREFSAWRHHVLKFEIKAPLMVARQLYKYSVGSCQREDQLGWNEQSRRYVTADPEFYVPGEWRSAPEHKRQGSGAPIDPIDSKALSRKLVSRQAQAVSDYEHAMSLGACVEQARGFLPAYFMYTTWRWTMSLNALILVLNERLNHEAQSETRAYAEALRDLAATVFPVTVESCATPG